jgi:integrase
MSSSQSLLDAAGRRRSPATTRGCHAGIPRATTASATHPTVDEIVAVMRQAGPMRHGYRLNALIVVLWRAGVRIQRRAHWPRPTATPHRGSILVRHGKKTPAGARSSMDTWGWSAPEPWLADRVELPVGPLFCVIDGPTRGRAWSASAARIEFHHLAVKAAVRRRFAPHQHRHAHPVELLHEGIPLPLIQRQLGHSHLSTIG